MRRISWNSPHEKVRLRTPAEPFRSIFSPLSGQCRQKALSILLRIYSLAFWAACV